jgi:hypothetical protein
VLPPKDGSITNVNNLSDESKGLLNQLGRLHIKAIDLIKQTYESLRSDGLTPEQARSTIQEHIEVSDRTIRRALPTEAKNINMLRTPVHKPSNATLVLDKEPDIPSPKPIIIEHVSETEIEPQPKPELVHRTIRITMSPENMVALGNAMVAKVKAEGFKRNYAIEYDYVDKALYVDIAEKWEKVLMVQ